MAQIPFSQTLIYRLVSLLADEQYLAFKEYLLKSNAILPHNLIEAIYNHPEWTAEDVCVELYGSADQKHNLNQLVSYTFRLTEWLSLNHPFYLTHNLQKITQLVGNGELQKANQLAENTLYIANKICDFSTQIGVLKFLSQQHYLKNKIKDAIIYHSQLKEAVDNESLFQEIMYKAKTRLHPLNPDPYSKDKIKQEAAILKTYFNHSCVSISLFSKITYLQTLHYFSPEEFLTKETLEFIERLENDLESCCYILLPFLFDPKSYLYFLKLNSTLYDLNNLEGKRQFKEMSKHAAKISYWNHYLNIPEMYAITAKASFFMSKYHASLNRADYASIVTPADLKEMKNLNKACLALMTKNNWEQSYQREFFHLMITKSLFKMLINKNDTTNALIDLEELLIRYQQINLTGSIDSIFIVLSIGYFSSGDFKKLEETFHRYNKLVKENPLSEDNDIMIHAYYYMAQWIRTGRGQYIQKLRAEIDRANTNLQLFGETLTAIQSIMDYYKIPTVLE